MRYFLLSLFLIFSLILNGQSNTTSIGSGGSSSEEIGDSCRGVVLELQTEISNIQNGDVDWNAINDSIQEEVTAQIGVIDFATNADIGDSLGNYIKKDTSLVTPQQLSDSIQNAIDSSDAHTDIKIAAIVFPDSYNRDSTYEYIVDSGLVSRSELSDTSQALRGWVENKGYITEAGTGLTKAQIEQTQFDTLYSDSLYIDSTSVGSGTSLVQLVKTTGKRAKLRPIQAETGSNYYILKSDTFESNRAYYTPTDIDSILSEFTSSDITSLRDSVKIEIAKNTTLRDSVKVLYDSISSYHLSIEWLITNVNAIWDSIEYQQPIIDNTPPTISSIEIGTYNDSTFVIKWSENIYKDSCSLDGIVVTENGNTFGTDSIWNNADSTYIRMDSIAVYGATYLFSYTRGSDSAFCDSSYNYVVNVSNHAITNNVIEIPLYGDELISNGTFNTNANGWGTTGWAWESDDSGGGRLRHDGAQSNTSSQSTTIQIASTYLTEYTIGDMSAGQFRIRVGTTAGTSRTTAGTYQEQIVCAGDNFVRLDPVVATFNGWVDNVSVKEVLGAYLIDENMMLYTLRDIFTNKISYKYVYEDLAASVEYTSDGVKLYEK